MPLPQNDADIERLIQHSVAFRLVRALLLAVDAAVASSAIARTITARMSLDALGVILLSASATHAAIVAFVPVSAAPGGRYLFAIGGGVAGVLLLAAERFNVRHLR